MRSDEQVGVMRKAIVQSSQLNESLHTQLGGFIVGMPESIHRFRNRSLVGRLYGRLEVDGCYEYCKRILLDTMSPLTMSGAWINCVFVVQASAD